MEESESENIVECSRGLFGVDHRWKYLQDILCVYEGKEIINKFRICEKCGHCQYGIGGWPYTWFDETFSHMMQCIENLRKNIVEKTELKRIKNDQISRQKALKYIGEH